MKATGLKHLLRSIRKSGVSFLAVAVIAGVSIAIFQGFQSSAHAILRRADAYFVENRLESLEISCANGITDEDIEAISAWDGVRSAEGGYTDAAQLELDGERVLVQVRSLLESMNDAVIVEGELPTAADEAAIEELLASENGISVGDTITLQNDGCLLGTQFTVTGIINLPVYCCSGLEDTRGSGVAGLGSNEYSIAFDKSAFDSDNYSGTSARLEANAPAGKSTSAERSWTASATGSSPPPSATVSASKAKATSLRSSSSTALPKAKALECDTMKKLLSILLAAALVCSLSAAALADFGSEAGSIAASGFVELDGALYVADSYAGAVWRVYGSSLKLVAGGSGRGYADGDADDAIFSEPWALAPYRDGLLISDSGNGALRYLDLNAGKVYTALDGLELPTGLASDGVKVYVADTGADTIWTLDENGGAAKLITAGLSEPTGLCWQDGVLYIADTGSHRILAYKDGRLSTVAGAALSGDAAIEGGFLDGAADEAQFASPQGIAISEDGRIYVADTGNGAVRLIEDGYVTTLAENEGGVSALVSPRGLAIVSGALYVGDVFSRCVLRLDADAVGSAFDDVDADAWYAGAVRFVSANSLFDGTAAGLFSPDADMTRAMVMTVLARLGGADTSGTPWYAAGQSWAVENGVSDGSSLESAVTREQLAAMLYRYADGWASGTAELDGFEDAASISSWAAEAMAWAVGNGIIDGVSEGVLAPQDTATRAQVAAMLQRFVEAG